MLLYCVVFEAVSYTHLDVYKRQEDSDDGRMAGSCGAAVLSDMAVLSDFVGFPVTCQFCTEGCVKPAASPCNLKALGLQKIGEKSAGFIFLKP